MNDPAIAALQELVSVTKSLLRTKAMNAPGMADADVATMNDAVKAVRKANKALGLIETVRKNSRFTS